MTDHPHDHQHPVSPAPVERRAAALEALLVERGLITPGYIDAVRRAYETQIGPMNGAKAVARAWLDASYKSCLLADGRRAVAELGIDGPEIEYSRVVENTPTMHDVVVCTLCSCYPRAVLGLSPQFVQGPALSSSRCDRRAPITCPSPSWPPS